MTTTPTRLALPPVSLHDAFTIGCLADEAQAALEHTLSQMRTLLQQRDLVAQWCDEDGCFRSEFLPVAAQYHRLQRALLELTGEQFDWTHDLATWVEAQR